MVIEAVPERIDLKTEVFGDLDRFAGPDAVLCLYPCIHGEPPRGPDGYGI
jgi:hypothetical protein